MTSASINSKIERLESQVLALKQSPWKLEREINNLLKALNAEPASERDYLKERLLTIAATAILTAGVVKGFDSSPMSKFFSLEKSQARTEQVDLSLAHASAKPTAKVSQTTTKPLAKAVAKPQVNQGISVERLLSGDRHSGVGEQP